MFAFNSRIFFFLRDTPATTFLVISATVGEAIFPIFVGSALKSFGAMAFPAMSIILTGLMVIMYAVIHCWGWENDLKESDAGDKGYIKLSQVDEEIANTMSDKGR